MVVEVLSRSTEQRDRNERFALFQRLDSLEEYVLVSQDERCIEVRKRDGRNWIRDIKRDEGKAEANLNKHAVSFEDAATVLADEQGDRFHVEEYDDAHSMEEDRWITTASHPSDRRIVLRVVWTPRTRSGATVTRIIGARAATRQERKIYEDEIASR